MPPPVNWIEDQNPFRLSTPPYWWLRRLAEIDPALRILPALNNFCYIVGRKTPRAKQLRWLTNVAKFTDNRGEQQRLIAHACVYVKTLTTFDIAGENFFGWLQAADSWNPANRAAPSIDVAIDRTIDAIDAKEARDAARQDAAIADEAEMRGSSAYTALLLRRGNMTFVQNPH